MRTRSASAYDRNVRQGCEIVDRKSLCVEPRRKLPVPYAGTHRHASGRFVQRHLVEMRERNLVARCVGNVIERMARA